MRSQHLTIVSPPAPLEVAIYARVSSDQQAERHTIDSQLSDLRARASGDGHRVRDDMVFVDNGTAAPAWSAPPWSACATSPACRRSTLSTSTPRTASPAATPTRFS